MRMKDFVPNFHSTSSVVVSVLLIGAPLIFVSVVVVMLDPSPRSWYSLPSSVIEKSRGSFGEISSLELQATVVGTPGEAPISAFSNHSSTEKQTSLTLLPIQQEKGTLESAGNDGLMTNISESEKTKIAEISGGTDNSTGEEKPEASEGDDNKIANNSSDIQRVQNKMEKVNAGLGGARVSNTTRESFEASEKDNKLGTENSSSEAQRALNKGERAETDLNRARAAIREAALSGNRTSPLWDPDYVPAGPIYHNAHAFHRSYLEMERVFKVYVYNEGKPPMFHDGPRRGIYSSEGLLIHAMEFENPLRTMEPDEAHVYFLPFSIIKMLDLLYKPKTYDTRRVEQTVRDYVGTIARIYPYWNKSLGADHVMLSCHDWGPDISEKVPNLYNGSIRVLCNANSSEGFILSKDAPLPEIHTKKGKTKGLIGGPSPSHRSILGFFAGRLHGPIRKILLENWKNKDGDLQVFESLPKHLNYERMMRNSRFCICPSGYEVASPRIVEAIYAECVPVIISEAYAIPFSDVLDWNSFSISVQVKDIPELKNMLMGISGSRYIRMQRRVKQVQRHFVINSPPKRFDLFHMILHSIWLRRLNVGDQQTANIIDTFN